ncbi:patatin-like phospholipase family protein [Sphingomonas mucosissima]|uniref:Patatin-like phospholipase n=1 Tax=Sphingomonas mucosissima TaxID=370959 RepID=A0A245ZQL4_9SPHN|nr:patatin-like phospholipase family protein [Sphingomonas mucosissima]OWK32011.1 patatin-like phospholipase [Sphingomonas mucosissima]
MTTTDPGDQAKERIALALSGGGSRAMAFHLGCLRALHDLGILQRVSTMSAVSGGSVIAGIYCSHPGDFAAFERRVREVLSQGFLRPAVRTALTTDEGMRAIGTRVLLAVDRTAAFVVRRALAAVRSRPKWGWLGTSPVLRRSSRTTILRRTFSKMFGGAKLTDLRSDRPRLVIVACELRAKAAFYFTADRLHCWRYGSSSSEGVELADAVAASAAYPAALPAIETVMSFEKSGRTERHRITLTDGGVYDNLGLAPFWPGRDSTISLDTGRHERIIACRAGYALNVADPASTMLSRMNAAFESVFARAQNLATTRLYDLARGGELRGFLLPYLGQRDANLRCPPDDLVRCEEVAGYPTNFSAMSAEWVDRLSRRGEQLVHALVRENWPEVLTANASVTFDRTGVAAGSGA